jgi:hypothetical protein
MREQLQMKKQKMIDELRELRKEYALDKEKSGEDALSNYEALKEKFQKTSNISNLNEAQRSTLAS